MVLQVRNLIEIEDRSQIRLLRSGSGVALVDVLRALLGEAKVLDLGAEFIGAGLLALQVLDEGDGAAPRGVLQGRKVLQVVLRVHIVAPGPLQLFAIIFERRVVIEICWLFGVLVESLGGRDLVHAPLLFLDPLS